MSIIGKLANTAQWVPPKPKSVSDVASPQLRANKIDDEERTNALGLFNTARSYWRSAEHLAAAGVKVTHPHAPVTFLFCHALELYLKAYLRGAGKSVADLKQRRHRVASLTTEAMNSGLKIGSEAAAVLSHIEDADVAMDARYIVTGFKELPTNEALSATAAEIDEKVCLALKNAGHGVREETFAPAAASNERGLKTDTVQALLFLFKTPERIDRHADAMAAALKVESSVAQYHIDQLVEAGLVERQGGNARFGKVYWALTSAGRQYVIDRGLNVG